MVVADAAYDPDTLSVGVLGRPHGIRGDIYFRPHNPRSRAFDDVRRLLIVREGQRRFYDVTSMRPVADAYVAHLDGVEVGLRDLVFEIGHFVRGRELID